MVTDVFDLSGDETIHVALCEGQHEQAELSKDQFTFTRKTSLSASASPLPSPDGLLMVQKNPS